MVVEAAEDVVQSADEMEGSLAVDEERLQLAAGHDVHSARERDSQNRVNRTRVRACPVVITQSSQERVGRPALAVVRSDSASLNEVILHWEDPVALESNG